MHRILKLIINLAHNQPSGNSGKLTSEASPRILVHRVPPFVQNEIGTLNSLTEITATSSPLTTLAPDVNKSHKHARTHTTTPPPLPPPRSLPSNRSSRRSSANWNETRLSTPLKSTLTCVILDTKITSNPVSINWITARDPHASTLATNTCTLLRRINP